MILDATLTDLHFAAILALAGFLVAAAAFPRGDLGGRDVASRSRSDIGYLNVAGYSVPAATARGAWRLVLAEAHLLALIPLAAVPMARGIGD
ncbi:MAG TPA: hypothetical protein VML91_15490 [Burkholderiales bacterium]|nr:hypothetical protein [Burkholderiales bacterium]